MSRFSFYLSVWSICVVVVFDFLAEMADYLRLSFKKLSHFSKAFFFRYMSGHLSISYLVTIDKSLPPCFCELIRADLSAMWVPNWAAT